MFDVAIDENWVAEHKALFTELAEADAD